MSTLSLGTTLGALEIGTILSAFLFGITTMQGYTYYSRFPNDRWQLKAFVLIVWALELSHFISITIYFYTLSILQSGNPSDAIFGRQLPSAGAVDLLAGTICSLVQSFFAERVRRFLCKPYLTILCWLLLCLRFLATIGIVIVTSRTTVADYIVHWMWLNLSIWVIGATLDVLVTVLLCYDLVKRKKESLRRTTRLLDRLLLITIETGLTTSLVSVTLVICFLTMRDNTIWVAMFFCLPRVFSITLLSTLNARENLRQMNFNVNSIIDVAKIPTSKPPLDFHMSTRTLNEYSNRRPGDGIPQP